MWRSGQGCLQSWARLLLSTVPEILSSCLQATELRAKKLTAVNSNSFPTANLSLPSRRPRQSGVAGWQPTPVGLEFHLGWWSCVSCPATPANTALGSADFQELKCSLLTHLWRQASRSYVTVHLIFLKRTHRIEHAAPSSPADTPPPSAPPPPRKTVGPAACGLAATVFSHGNLLPLPPAAAAPAQLFLATRSPSVEALAGLERRAQWLPVLPLCLPALGARRLHGLGVTWGAHPAARRS